MARGWESKSVESQQVEERTSGKGKKSRAEMDRDSRRHSLEMSRRRIVSELASTNSAMRRQLLEAALTHLDEELGKL